MTEIFTTQETTRIDEIAIEQYGFHSGAVEAMLEVNVGLAEVAFNIPFGTRILCPIISKPANHSLRLWD